MATLQSKLILSLTDRISGPSRAINQSLSRLQNSMNQTRTALFDAVGVGYVLARSLSAPIKAGVEFETALENIGQKADIPRARLAALGAELRKIGNLTSMSGANMATGMDTLLGLGASEKDALAMLPAIGKTAVAYQASIADLSNAGFAALDNLKVPAGDFSKALDAMAQAGKDGAFELKDMAQYLPSLTAGYQSLKQTGVPAVADLAAALQIVRKGAGDSSEAANNLKNVLQKIRAPATVKAFKKMGVNLERELAKASKRGLTPIEAIAEITNKTLKGDLSKIGYLFEDAQVQQGLRPLIQNIEQYRKIRADALKAQGVVEADYLRRLQTSEGALLRFKALLDNLSVSIGSALLPALNSVLEKLGPIVTRFSEFADKHPKLISSVVGVTAALVGMRVAFLALKFAGLFAATGFLAVAARALRLGGVLARVLKFGSLFGIALAAIGAAGTFIYKNWSGIATMFEKFGSAFSNAIEPIGPMLQPVTDGVRRLYDWFSRLTGPISGFGKTWSKMGTDAGRTMGKMLVDVVKFATDLPKTLSSIDLSKIDLAGLWSGLTASATKAIQGLRQAIVTGIAGIDWHAIGAGVSTSISGLLDAAKSAVAGTNWADVGATIAAGINSAFKSLANLRTVLTAAILGSDGGTGIAGAVASAFASAVSAIDFSSIGKKLVEATTSGISALRTSITYALANIDWSGLGASASTAVTTLLTSIRTAISSADWGFIGRVIGDGIANAFVGFSKIHDALMKAIFGGDGGADLVQGFATSLKNALLGFDWLSVGRGINDLIIAGIKANLSLLNGIFTGAFGVDLSAEGARAIQSLWDGMQAKFAEFIAWVKTLPSQIVSAFGHVTLTTAVDFAGKNLGVQPGEGAKANYLKNHQPGAVPVDGAKAKGGPVRGGMTYLVGERGPEIFSPSRAGVITPNHALRAAGQLSDGGDIHIVQHVTITGVSDPRAAASRAMEEAGAKVKAAVNSSFGAR